MEGLSFIGLLLCITKSDSIARKCLQDIEITSIYLNYEKPIASKLPPHSGSRLHFSRLVEHGIPRNG